MDKYLCVVDELGRIALPQSIIAMLGIAENSPLEFKVENDSIVINKFIEESCAFCGSRDIFLGFVNNKYLCRNCGADMRVYVQRPDHSL